MCKDHVSYSRIVSLGGCLLSIVGTFLGFLLIIFLTLLDLTGSPTTLIFVVIKLPLNLWISFPGRILRKKI